MNYLAHLWLADRARLPLAGAILGDALRGALPADMPAALARSVYLHRRIDAATDRHERIVALRGTFAPGARRYAGIVLDILLDHALADGWPAYSPEPLSDFAERAAREVARAAPWFTRGGHPAPTAPLFAALLVSYRTPEGIDRALARTARRLRRSDGWQAATAAWPARLPRLREDLPVLLADLAALTSAVPAPP